MTSARPEVDVTSMRETVSIVAPGTKLRRGLDLILEARRGGLIVIGDSDEVKAICSGGFVVDSEFSPEKLAELAKMDGAIILDSEVSHISWANIHLLPDPRTSTTETGTRHRTAERVARSLGVPVIAVSSSRNSIGVYLGDQVRPVLSASRILERSNQAVQTLERYRTRLDVVSRNLSFLELEDLVSLRDVVEVVQRAEMVVRISDEIRSHLVELGTDGRLVRFQLEELMMGVSDDRRLLLMDYLDPDQMALTEGMEQLTGLTDDQLLDDSTLASALQLSTDPVDLDELVSSRGYRILSKLPRVHEKVVANLIESLGGLAAILRADIDSLAQVPGVGEERAQALKDGTMKLVENAFFDRM